MQEIVILMRRQLKSKLSGIQSGVGSDSHSVIRGMVS